MNSPDMPAVAAGLRASAEALSTHGHSKGSYINRRTGSLCMDGALMVGFDIEQVAVTPEPLESNTEARRFTLHEANPLSLYESDPTREHAYLMARTNYTAAIQALAPLLPVEHDEHEERTGGCEYNHAQINDGDTGPFTRVHHFNDLICTGGADAQRLLIQAAEKIEADL